MKKTDASDGWLKKHRKQVAVHSLVLGAFILYCIFLAGPLQDKLGSIPSESKLQDISIPAATDNIQCSIGRIDATIYRLEINGWAFIKGKGCEDSKTFIVLKSADHTYVFATALVIREGVTKAFKKSGINLDCSGFLAVIPLKKIENGEYKVGVYIKKGDSEALQYTNKSVTK